MSAAAGDQQLDTTDNGLVVKRRWTFKSVVLGDSGVGKTWLVNTALAGLRSPDDSDEDIDTEETDHCQATGTVGVTFNLTKMELEGGNTVMLQVWDTSGKERYRGLLANYMSDLRCAIIVFDPCRDSAETCCASLAGWHQLVRENLNCDSSSTSILFCVVAIFGCDRDADGKGVNAGSEGRDNGGCRGCCCDHLRCLSAGRSFAEALKGRFFQCRRVPGFRSHRTCQWLDGQQLSAAWLGCELLRRQFSLLAGQPAGSEASTEKEETPMRRQQARSCCQQLAIQLHALLRLPAMVALLLISHRPPDRK